MAVYDINGNVISSGGSTGDTSVYIPDVSLCEYDKICKAINHRGWRDDGATENTIAAYKASKVNGFYYVETDICSTSDDIAVLHHDTTISGTSISSMTYAECLEAEPTLSRFDEFIALCRNIGLHPYIEFKQNYTQSQVNSLVDLVHSYQMQKKVTWFGGYTVVSKVKAYDPDARLGILSHTVTSETISQASSLKLDTNEVFIDTWLANLTSEILASVKAAGLPLEVYTFSKGSTAENEILGMDAYITGFTADDRIAGKVLYDANIV